MLAKKFRIKKIQKRKDDNLNYIDKFKEKKKHLENMIYIHIYV